MGTGKEIIKKCYKTSFINALASNLTACITTIVDGVIIGHFLPHDAMSGYGIAATLVLLFLVLGMMFSKGTRRCLYNASGKGEDNEVLNDYYNTSVWSSLIISVILSSLLFVFANDITNLIGAKKVSMGIHEACVDYIKGIALGAPFMITGLAANCCIILDNDARISMISMVVMIVTDIIGDIIAAACNFGIFGIAVASSISYFLALITIIPHFFKESCSYHIRFRPLNLSFLREIIRDGAPSSANSFFAACGTMTINFILLRVASSDEMAAFSVRTNVSNLFGVFGLAMGAVAFDLGSLTLGEDNRRDFLDIAKICFRKCFTVGGILTVACLIFTPLIDDMYGHQDIEALVALCVRIFILRIPFQAALSVYANLSNSLGRRVYSTVIYVFDDLMFPVLISIMLMGEFKAVGVWLSLTLCVPATLLLTYAYAYVKNKKLTVSLSGWIMLPEDFGVDDDMYYNTEFNVKDTDRLEEVKQAVYELFRKKQDNEKSASLAKEIVEIYGRKIIEHGSKSKHAHYMDICAFLKNDDCKIVIKDDCSSYELLSETDKDNKRLGDEVRSRVKNIDYRRTMQINELRVAI